MFYKIIFNKNSTKFFKKLDKTIQKEIIFYLEQEKLLRNPTLFGKPLLYEEKGNWRYRVRDYRIICRILKKELTILILDIGHRKEIYK